MKSFKKLKEVIVKNLDMRDFFMSDVFRQHLSGIVKMVSERYGNERMSVKTAWGGNDIAYTDNRLVFINLNNQIVEKIEDTQTRYLCCLGFLGHELGHVLYTDFDLFDSVADGKTGKYIGLNEENRKIADEISDYRDKGFNKPITIIYHHIQNSVEDGYVNRKISKQFPGTFKEGISLLHKISYSGECGSTGKRVDDILNVILSVSLGVPVFDKATAFIGEETVNKIKDIFKGFERVETPDERVAITNNLFCLLWPDIKPMLDNAQSNNQGGEQGQQNGQGKGQSDSNGSNGENNSSSGSQNGADNGNGSLSDMLNNLKPSSQTGKGKGILNSKQKSSSGNKKSSSDKENSSDSKKNSDKKENDSSSSNGPSNNKESSSDKGNNSLSAEKNKTSSENGDSSESEGTSNDDKSDDNSNSDNNSSSDGQEAEKEENNSDGKNSDGAENEENSPENNEDSSENTNMSEKNEELDKNQGKDTGNGKGKENKPTETNDGAEGENQGEGTENSDSDGQSGFEDMSETPTGSQLSYGSEDVKDSKAALEGLLSQYAQRKISEEPELVEKLELQNAAAEINSDASSEHYGYPFKVNNITEANHIFYDEAARNLSGISKRLTKRVEQVLEDQNDGGVCKNLLKGNKVNPAAAVSSNGRVFKRNILPESKDIAISLLIDESGSMHGKRIEKALEMAILVESFCKSLDIPLSIVGHSDSGDKVQLNNYIRFEDVNPKRKYNLGNMRAGGCNRDGFALKYCIKNLLERDEENKLMIIISDGRPNSRFYSGASAEKDLQNIKNEFERKGGRLIAAAIGDDRDTIKRIYGNSFLDVTDVNKLPLKMASIISKYVQD